MKKIVRLTESDLVRIVKRIISESAPDPKRVKYFDTLAQRISNKLVGKTLFFGNIGVLKNSSIIIEKYTDRNHGINLSGQPIDEFALFFDVRRKEEDLYSNEKAGTRIYKGTLRIEAKYSNGSLVGNPDVSLYPGQGDNIKFDLENKPSKPFSWDMVGGVDLWSQVTKIQ